jgi:Ribonuclease G/E
VSVVERWADAAIGETREVLLRNGVPFALHVSRWSDSGRRALWGETYSGRVRTIDRRRRGAFVDIGLGDVHAFLRLDARSGVGGAHLTEGQSVLVEIVRETARDKSAVARLLGAADGLSPGLRERPESDLALDAATPTSPETRARIDQIVDAALARRAPIAGGGALIIEPTAALVAIDVDAAGRGGAQEPERFARELNLAAAAAALRELRLRNLGGIIAIDFVSQRDRPARDAVVAALKAAAVDDPWGTIIAPMSRFGVVEMSRGQLRQPLAERLLDADGRPSAETMALKALRGMEREARTARGREVIARVAPETAAWLEAATIGWRAALNQRIGPRWRIVAIPDGLREHLDVEAS